MSSLTCWLSRFLPDTRLALGHNEPMPPVAPPPVQPAGRPATGPAVIQAFVASAALLTLELLSLRLVAPYVGLTIQASSAVIGMALAGIASGAWIGGQLADTHEPRRLVGPLFLIAAALTVVMLPLVRLLGESLGSAGPAVVLLMAMVAVFLPSTALAAVPPLLVKQLLADLRLTGSTVGLVTSAGTIGGLVATFLTGFLLVAYFPVRGLVLTIAGVLLVVGLVLTFRARVAERRGRRSPAPALLLVGALVLGGVALLQTRECDVETAYHCARIESAGSGQILRLDTLLHSYVDQRNPTDLRFAYTQALAAVTQSMAPPGQPLTALHIGGGGATMPRYLAATRPGSDSTVLEVDRGVVGLDRARLGLRTGPHLRVRVIDGRVGLRESASDAFDLVIGDAFGGVSVPWHLTTLETARDVRRVLHPGGIYAVNVIDFPPNRFAHAELVTLAAAFSHVAVLASPASLANTGGGNAVLVASDRPLPLAGMQAQLADHPEHWQLLADAPARAWAGEAQVLTDDYAPVDQILTPAPPA